MMVLDTNVISEISKPQPDKKVVAFLANLEPKLTYITSITVMELYYGCNLMEEGMRKQVFRRQTARIVNEQFQGQILDFGREAAEICGALLVAGKRSGNIRLADIQIASIVAALGYQLATRNVRDFEWANLKLINPWEA